MYGGIRMKSLLEQEDIIEQRDAQNLAYILQKPNLFYSIGYKVMQSQEKNGFIRCVRISHNGKDKLLYDISNYKTFESLLLDLRPEIFLTILINLMDTLIEVKNNGFMQCENTIISFDRIYVDCNNYKVYLIYLPIDRGSDIANYSLFETHLKSNIEQVFHTNPDLDHLSFYKLLDNLKKPNYTIEAISAYLKEIHIEDHNESNVKQKSQSAQEIYKDSYKGEYEELYKEQVVLTQEKEPENKKNGFKLFGRKPKQKKEKETLVEFQTQLEGGATEILDAIFTPSIVFSGVRTPEKIDIIITKPEFVIGKMEGSVDGTILFNKAISRIHCKFIWSDGNYLIEDLGSANGTYLNGKRLGVKTQVPIKPGDKVRLADSDFIIKALS